MAFVGAKHGIAVLLFVAFLDVLVNWRYSWCVVGSLVCFAVVFVSGL